MKYTLIIVLGLFSIPLYSQSNGFQGSIPISSTPIAGDVTGTLGASSVVKAQGRDIANMSPTNGQILKWISANNRWEPANETGGGATYTAGSGININGSNVISNTGDLSTTNEIQTIDQFNITSNTLNLSLSSDGVSPSTVSLASYLDNTDSQTLSVGSGNLSISGGNSVAVTTIAPLQSVASGTGISINTVSNVSTITNTGDTDASNDLTTSTSFAGDVSGAYNTLSVDKVKGKNVVTAGITDGQILKWNNTNNQFEPSNDLTGSTSYTAGTGIDINGSNVISNTGDLSGTNEGSLTVGAGVSNTSLINSNTSGSTAVTITASTGLSTSESGNNITLTNTSPDQTVTLTNGGGVVSSGTYPNFTLTATDPSLSNEGSLTVAAGTSTTSVVNSNTSGQTGVTIEAGTGLSITESGSTITLTNAAPDQTVVLNNGTGINVTGTYPTFTINATGASDTHLGNANLSADANRTYDVNGFSLAMIGSTYRTTFSTAGNVGISTTAFTPLNRLHIQNTGTSAFTSTSVKGITLTGNLTNQPGIAFESPNATSGAKGFSWGLKSASSNALMTLKSLNDDGTDNVDNIITSTTTGNVGIGTATPGYKLEVSGTGAVRIPFGTTAQRPAGATGVVRVNTTSPASLEWHDGTNWNQIKNVGTIKYKFGQGYSSPVTDFYAHTIHATSGLTIDVNDVIQGDACVSISQGTVPGGGNATWKLALRATLTGGGTIDLASTIFSMPGNNTVILQLHNIVCSINTDGGNYYAGGEFNYKIGQTAQNSIHVGMSSPTASGINVGTTLPSGFDIVVIKTTGSNPSTTSIRVLQADFIVTE